MVNRPAVVKKHPLNSRRALNALRFIRSIPRIGSLTSESWPYQRLNGAMQRFTADQRDSCRRANTFAEVAGCRPGELVPKFAAVLVHRYRTIIGMDVKLPNGLNR